MFNETKLLLGLLFFLIGKVFYNLKAYPFRVKNLHTLMITRSGFLKLAVSGWHSTPSYTSCRRRRGEVERRARLLRAQATHAHPGPHPRGPLWDSQITLAGFPWPRSAGCLCSCHHLPHALGAPPNAEKTLLEVGYMGVHQATAVRKLVANLTGIYAE